MAAPTSTPIYNNASGGIMHRTTVQWRERKFTRLGREKKHRIKLYQNRHSTEWTFTRSFRGVVAAVFAGVFAGGRAAEAISARGVRMMCFAWFSHQCLPMMQTCPQWTQATLRPWFDSPSPHSRHAMSTRHVRNEMHAAKPITLQTDFCPPKRS